MKKGIVYYTDNRLDPKILKACQDQLVRANLPITSASLKPMDFGDNVVINEPRGYYAYFKQIVAALEKSTADIVFFCEHDVLYTTSRFDFEPQRNDTFYYNLNVWRLKYPENYAVSWDAHQVAQLCCYRDIALQWYKKKLIEYENAPVKIKDTNLQLGNKDWDRKFEPEDKVEHWHSEQPDIDIRHGENLTKSKWSIEDFRNKDTAINFKVGECPTWARKLLLI